MNVKPTLKKTLDSNILDLIVTKENSNTPSNMLNANTLFINSNFLLNEEKIPFNYKIKD